MGGALNESTDMNEDILVAAAGASGGITVTLGVVWAVVKVTARKYGPPLLLKILCENSPVWKEAVTATAKEIADESRR